MPILLKPLRQAYPGLTIELWEDQTRALIDGLRNHRLDAALLATAPDAPEITELALFDEPLLAALPLDHPLVNGLTVTEESLAEEMLVLADGHCLAIHALAACGKPAASRSGQPAQRNAFSNQRGAFPIKRIALQSSMQAATLETLVNLVAAGYGATLIPALAADFLGQRGIAIRPLAGQSSRTIRLVSRPGFPRPQALRALEKTIRRAIKPYEASGWIIRA
jgi:LysR family hydrogen peroxide-inducible transcriptional activator